MHQNIKSLIFNSVYLSVFLSLMALSFVGIMSLNPVIKKVDDPQVAGINSDEIKNNNLIPLIVENISENKVVLNKISNGIYTAVINFEEFRESYESVKFLNFINLNNFDIKVTLKPYLVGDVGNFLEIDIQDQKDIITLFTNKSSKNRELTLPANSERTFFLNIKSSVEINFPFGVFFDIE